MRKVRPGYTIGALTIVLAIIGGVGYSLARSQARARGHQEVEFAHRAALAARLTGGALSSGGTTTERQSFSGAAAGLPTAMREWESSGQPDQKAGLLDARGRVLVSWPVGSQRDLSAAYPRREYETALRAEASVYGDLIPDGPRRPALLWAMAPFDTRYGERILASLTAAAPVSSFAAPYLRSAPAVEGARAYLIDGRGLVLASSTNLRQGALLPGRNLRAAVVGGAGAGRLGPTYWVTAPVDAGTGWRIVFAVSDAKLLSGVEGSNAVAWWLFGAFVLAVLALLAVGAAAIRSSAQLGGARERERSAQLLAHELLHDALTGLPNRALFLDRTETAILRARRAGRSVAVIFTDVDQFKRINDSLGHEAGDELLAELARRLRGAVRPQDTVSRFGGDEFLVLCDELSGEDGALRIASRISRALRPAFELGGRSVHMTCCIGVAVKSSATHTADAGELVRDADAAMYQAKATGRGRVHVFDEQLHAEAVRRLDTEVAMRTALSRAELFVHYQPIVALPDERLWGVEALVRWNRPGHGLVPPVEFIGLAEECGLIDEIGRLVLHTAMRDVQSWDEEGLLPDDFVLCVNVSPLQLANPAFPAEVADVLESWSLEPSTLCLEITESAVAAEPEIDEPVHARLRALGVKLAIDDFGVGLSSLKQLVRSPGFDVIKLDRSFVAEIARVRERAVVAGVASTAELLGMAAIAEGVERQDQADQLIGLGYTLAQGFHFARPMTADAIQAALLEDDRATTPVA